MTPTARHFIDLKIQLLVFLFLFVPREDNSRTFEEINYKCAFPFSTFIIFGPHSHFLLCLCPLFQANLSIQDWFMTHREIKRKIKIEGEKFQSRISQSILDLKKTDSKSGSGKTCPPFEGLAKPLQPWNPPAPTNFSARWREERQEKWGGGKSLLLLELKTGSFFVLVLFQAYLSVCMFVKVISSQAWAKWKHNMKGEK